MCIVNIPFDGYNRNGCNMSGLFLACWFIFEKIKEEKEVDIFHAVKRIRISRPQFVINQVTKA